MNIKKRFNLKNISQTVFVLGMAVIICLVAFVLLQLRFYRVFNEKQIVAMVECRDGTGGQRFLDVKFYNDSHISQNIEMPFWGDEWVLEGRIIRWKNFLFLFGARDYYCLERISGRFLDPEKERTQKKPVYALSRGPDKLWLLVYKFRRFLPFVEAAYGTSAFVPFEAGKKFNVYVVHSGFMIKDMTPPKKRHWWSVG